MTAAERSFIDRPSGPCPNCTSQNTHTIDGISRMAAVHYSRCTRCGHVWSLPTHPPGQEPTTIVQGLPPGILY